MPSSREQRHSSHDCAKQIRALRDRCARDESTVTAALEGQQV
jgi:hypothetical protein